MKAILWGTVLGGLVVFVWGAVSHMVLVPPSAADIVTLPEEETLVPALSGALHAPGFYFFPGPEHDPPSEEEEAEWNERYRRGPTGIVIYQPSGADPMAPSRFLNELASNLLGALLACLLLRRSTLGYPGRVLAVTALGLFAWLAIDVSYWNWYRFPDAFTFMAGVDAVVGWGLAGLVIARFTRPAAA